MKKAMLYPVATSIGNTDDITLRALEILRQVNYVASKDTCKTGVLLKHFQTAQPQIAFREFIEGRAGQRLLDALVKDAGTPGISNPGYMLVRRAVAANLDVR